jgi:hypothetical protein
MRYHVGLGVGHLHAHPPTATSIRLPEEDIHSREPEPDLDEMVGDNDVSAQTHGDGSSDSDVYDSDRRAEFDLQDRDLEGWEDVESEDSEGGECEEMEEEDFTGI